MSYNLDEKLWAMLKICNFQEGLTYCVKVFLGLNKVCKSGWFLFFLCPNSHIVVLVYINNTTLVH